MIIGVGGAGAGAGAEYVLASNPGSEDRLVQIHWNDFQMANEFVSGKESHARMSEGQNLVGGKSLIDYAIRV